MNEISFFSGYLIEIKRKEMKVDEEKETGEWERNPKVDSKR